MAIVLALGIQPLASHAAGPLPASALFAGQASYIGNADTPPAGHLDGEQDFTYTKNPHNDYSEFPLTLSYGVLPRWELSAAVYGEYQSFHPNIGKRQTAFGFGDIPVYSKVKVLDQEQWFASQSLSLEIKIPTASRREGLGTGNPDYDLTWIISKDLTDRLTGDLNVGYTWLGDAASGPLQDQLHYGAALQYNATDKWSLFGQLLTCSPDSQLNRIQVAFTSGVGWQITPRLQLHGSFTKGVGSGARIIDASGTVGLVWTFKK